MTSWLARGRLREIMMSSMRITGTAAEFGGIA